ncbi:MAG TPA: RNA polymerase sigma factor [Polyangiaceae bacterium]|nr:RNA polymerase sigma factor [Polyangiaceae bacterium]
MTISGLTMMTEQALASDAELVDELVVRLRRAEPSAVAEVYDAHHAAVRAFAKRLLGDAASAEDLVHEVFVSLPQAVRKFRGDSALRTFLISIAVNHARHFVRAAQRRRRAISYYGETKTHETNDPEHEARRRELAELLTRALDTLPVDQRVAFVLCEVEERSAVEAAEIVGAPEATLRTRLFHAKRKLRIALETEGVG